ncbi:hypothetical protein [Paraburkholderia tropica]|uniref:hypothetical protein n=1 Tax=Paraburkholderia tropica TaxID=92647 RepID=UPI003D2837E6
MKIIKFLVDMLSKYSEMTGMFRIGRDQYQLEKCAELLDPPFEFSGKSENTKKESDEFAAKCRLEAVAMIQKNPAIALMNVAEYCASVNLPHDKEALLDIATEKEDLEVIGLLCEIISKSAIHKKDEILSRYLYRSVAVSQELMDVFFERGVRLDESQISLIDGEIEFISSQAADPDMEQLERYKYARQNNEELIKLGEVGHFEEEVLTKPVKEAKRKVKV